MQNEGKVYSLNTPKLTIKEAEFLAAISKQLTIDDLMLMFDCSESTARRRIKQYREAEKLLKHQKVTVAGFLGYWLDLKIFEITQDHERQLRA